ncbi:rhamnosyl transferase [Halalkalicoccus jeotgali B3]|uniref:Rhamnosyl transferase n=1 Tax=Halalkalicoccus jeotgali (strain DSM 18796 / CECT 7217 / JCM 14584 / KCTC 4019 / B3) TaxID=795797 RepID=D8J6R8_HALJB|nr:rhamnosyl transferase [Halalkalicoccus jeotgali B3]ELY34011.1 rhamnosyl transferase [Halalkalicoccus jeotgali B3]
MRFSIICPVYNDPAGIYDTIQSLIDIDYPKNDYEIIVVDNNSSDETLSVIKKLESDHPHLVTSLVESDIQSSYAARNTGINAASGEYLAFIDADMTAPPEWLNDLEQCFRQGSDYIGCDVNITIPNDKQTIWARYDRAQGLPVHYYMNYKNYSPTCSLAVRRSVIENVGLFDSTVKSGGDAEFGHRVNKRNYCSYYASDTHLQHPARTSASNHFSKAARLGRASAERRISSDNSAVKIIDFLPPNPIRLYRRLRDLNYSLSILLTFYMITYLLKIRKIVSRIRTVF